LINSKLTFKYHETFANGKRERVRAAGKLRGKEWERNAVENNYARQEKGRISSHEIEGGQP